ncbi:MAG: PH domain-containing protein [Candidatus Woesearchaeota archaeon]|jgi:uncharacterized membrane protein YdbT with pleckstrin-like domain|nr:PH domain-containing protein [Candidatus Woesearchaeota archaeon]
MEKIGNIIIMKSHFINTLMPKFIKHLFWNSIVFLILYGIYYLLDNSAKYDFDTIIILSLIFLTIIFSIIKISKDLIKILNTTYEFHPNHLEVKYKFIKEETHSINYKQITDIKVNKTIWDRICKVGDIEIHTANDSFHNEKTTALILKDIRHADKIEDEITRKIHSYKTPHQ